MRFKDRVPHRLKMTHKPYSERDWRGNRPLKLNYEDLAKNLWSLRKSIFSLVEVISFKGRLERKARPFRVRP
jgi:hypothetical protein